MLTDLWLTPASPGRPAREALTDAAIGLLATLRRRGHVDGEWVLGWVGGRLRATVDAAAPGALARRHLASAGWDALRPLCAGPPEVQPLERGRRPPDWRKERALYLFTHLLDVKSPVCAGSDGRAVPLYLLPLRDPERLSAWAAEYRDLDSVAMACGALEVPAYRELASPESALARQGRALAKAVEQATDKPTYYYLHRYWARPVGEESRPCPGCGQRWAQPGPRGKGLAWFDFRCERCRLVSHAGPSTESARLARIGDWPRKHRGP